MAERSEVIIVGGGQSGLVAGYYLQRAGIPFVILDAGSEVGQAWRERWDSLELFTIAQYCSLPGLRFPGFFNRFPDKNEMADYVAAYARHFELPVRLNTAVTSLTRTETGYHLETTNGEYDADHVIVATGAYQNQYVPPVASGLADDVFQVHTGSYTNPRQLPAGTVVVVGAANSGAQIAIDLAGTHTVVLSQGSPLPHGPRRFLGIGLHWWGDKFGIIAKPLIGERDRIHKKTILVGPSLKKISKRHGIRLVGRTVECAGRTVRFEGGEQVEVDAVVWATGFRPDYPWIRLPIFRDDKLPEHERGVVATAPGLYFLGMQCQYSYGSGLIWWVKEDAEYLVDQVARTRRGDFAHH